MAYSSGMSINPFSSSSSTAFSATTTLHSQFRLFNTQPWFPITRHLEHLPSLSVPLSLVCAPPHNHEHLITQYCSSTIATPNPLTDTDAFLLSVFQEMGVSDRETQFLLRKYPSLRVTSLECIRSRILALQSVGISVVGLSRLVLKRPDILTAEEVESFLGFFRDNLQGKLGPAQVERLLGTMEPRFFMGFEEKVQLLLDYGVPQEKLSHVLNNAHLIKAICTKSIEEIGRMLAYLDQFGVVILILRRPAILSYDLDLQLIPRIGFLLALSNGNVDATATVLHKLPFIVAYSLEHLRDHVEFLRSFAGLSDEDIFRIVLVYPNFFSASRKKKLHPRITFLKECGLNSEEICKFLIRAPLFVSLSFEDNLAYKLVFLVKIGYENRTKDLALAMGSATRTSCKNMQEVISLLLNYGLMCEDILAMSKKHPQVLQYNHESLEEKMDYLIEQMGREVGELLAFPAFLGYKLDGRIKHRYEEKKKILGEGLSLNKLLSQSTARFSLKKKENHPISDIDSPSEIESKGG